jgi:quercetin dioxygenase-like cupin family protein
MKIRFGLVVAMCTAVLMAQQPAASSKPAAKGAENHGKKSAQPGAKGAAKKPAKNAFTPDEVQYGPPPPFVPPGAELAVLEGNPMGTTGSYTIRVKMPDGYKVPPHWHPKRENVTIVSGNLKVGMGDTFDDSKMASFPQGSFAYLDPSMHHYVQASGETVVQIHGFAPVKFNYVNPADDPSHQH